MYPSNHVYVTCFFCDCFVASQPTFHSPFNFGLKKAKSRSHHFDFMYLFWLFSCLGAKNVQSGFLGSCRASLNIPREELLRQRNLTTTQGKQTEPRGHGQESRFTLTAFKVKA